MGLNVAGRGSERDLPRNPRRRLGLTARVSAEGAVRGIGSWYGSNRFGRLSRVRSVPNSLKLELCMILPRSLLDRSYNFDRFVRFVHFVRAGTSRPLPGGSTGSPDRVAVGVDGSLVSTVMRSTS